MNIVIIGAYGHFHMVIDAVKEDARLKLQGIAPGSEGESLEALKDYCRKADLAPAVYDDYREMLKESKADLAVINSVFGLNRRLIACCLNQGIAVYSEKPLAAEAEELQALEALYRKAERPLGAMLTLRYTPWFLSMKKCFETGAIGELRLIRAQKSYKLGQRPDFFRERALFTGLIPWVGIHAVDWVLAFGGRFKGGSARHSRRYNRGMGDMERSAVCLMELENEVFATVSVDYLRPAAASRNDDDRLRLVGTKGTLESRDGKVWLEDEKAPKRLLPLENALNPFTEFLRLTAAGEDRKIAEASFRASEAALYLRDAADRATERDAR